jgi:transposase
MSKTFRPWNVDQPLELPRSILEFVPAGHVAHFIRNLVREQLDLSPILDSYTQMRGYPPFHPTMMTALLLYAYSQGVYSSRKIAQGCENRLDFLAVTAMNRPDHRTISRFRRRHLSALGGLFVQILQLCQKAGLAELGHVSLDGTKIKANASKRKAMSYGRMVKTEAELESEVAAWLSRAATADDGEDAELGEARGDETPAWMADKTRRLAKIKEAKAALEAEARAKGEAEEKEKAAAEREGRKPRRKQKGKKPRPGKEGAETEAAPQASGDPTPDDKAQKNFTDPESRIMKGPDGFLQGYNAQAVVDAKAQVILAHGLTDCSADSGALIAMVAAVKTNTGRTPEQFSADAGYCSDANLAALEAEGIDAYVATGRHKHGAPAPDGGSRAPEGSRIDRMRAKLRKDGFQSPYRLRKQTVEPVFGQIKAARGFRQFLLRGKAMVMEEWALICSVHNLLKLANAFAQPA